MKCMAKIDIYRGAHQELEGIVAMQAQAKDVRLIDPTDPTKGSYADLANKFFREYASKQLDPALIPANLEDMHPEVVQGGVKEGSRRADVRGRVAFQTGLEEILNSVQDLERLTISPEVAEAIADDDRGLYQVYQGYQGLQHLYDRFKANGRLSQEDTKIIIGAAQVGVGEQEVERLKAQCYTDEGILNGGRALAMLAAEKHLGKEKLMPYAQKGLEVQLDGAKKAYEDMAKTKNKKAEDLIRDAVKTLANMDREGFETAYNLVYAAEQNKVADLYEKKGN